MLARGPGGTWDREVTREEEEAKLKHIDDISEHGAKYKPASF